MFPLDRKFIAKFLLSFALVAIAAGFARFAKADGPSAEDYANLNQIKANQKILAETREAHEQFMAAKESNEELVRKLNDSGWNVSWQIMELVPTISPVSIRPPKEANQNVDLDKLADAVAMHETKYCTSPGSPTANARNNCWGIMHWPNGVRTLRTFATIEDGKTAFIELWKRGYGGRLPTFKDAKVYSGNDKAATWHANVLHFYETL